MVYQLTLYQDQYETLLTTMPDLALQAKPVRDPTLATDRQCRYMASLLTANRPKAEKRTAWKVAFDKLMNDPTMTMEKAHDTIDQLTGKAPVLDSSDIPW